MRPKSKAAASLALATQLAAFVAKYDPAVGRLVRATRAAMRRRLPSALELIYDTYRFLAMGTVPRSVLPTVLPPSAFPLAALLRTAIASARTPLPTLGRGRTIIKSISAKQRPRRK